jgi:putative nucleotidyltransferase with HDIG domain
MTTRLDEGIEEKINRVVGGINNLPTPPIVFTQIQKVLNNPNTSAFDIAAILQEDPAMSAKVLKLTNSAYYGLSREIDSVKQAVMIVGLDAVKNLVLSASVISIFSKDQIDQEFQDYFWRHSLATAFGARMLSRLLRTKLTFDAESGFSAGMLHDIGKMVISVYMSEESQQIKAKKAEQPNIPDYKIEDDILGYNHAHIGALLGQHWKLPTTLIEAVKFHHFPQLIETKDNNLPYLIHLANHLAILTFDVDPDNETQVDPLQPGVLDAVGSSQEEIEPLCGKLREEYGRAETFMEMAKGAA